MLKWRGANLEAQTEGFVFGSSKSLEHLCWEHGNLHFIPQPEAESICSRVSAHGGGGGAGAASSMGSTPSSAQTTEEAAEEDYGDDDDGGAPSLPHLHNARVEDLLRGFAKDPKALAHTLQGFTVRTLLAMTDSEFQSMFDMFDRSELSVADFFALKVGVREAKKLLLTIQF